MRFGLLAGVVSMLLLAAEARAQLPRNGNGLTFVPVDTSKNLATPVPTFNKPVEKGSLMDRLRESLATIMPFKLSSRRNALPEPQMPTTKLPQGTPSRLPSPVQPTTKLPNAIQLPKLPTPVSGSIK